MIDHTNDTNDFNKKKRNYLDISLKIVGMITLISLIVFLCITISIIVKFYPLIENSIVNITTTFTIISNQIIKDSSNIVINVDQIQKDIDGAIIIFRLSKNLTN